MSCIISPLGARVRSMAMGDVIEIIPQEYNRAYRSAYRWGYFLSIVGRRAGLMCLKRVEAARWGTKKAALVALAIGDSIIEPDLLKKPSWEHISKYSYVPVRFERASGGLKITRIA